MTSFWLFGWVYWWCFPLCYYWLHWVFHSWNFFFSYPKTSFPFSLLSLPSTASFLCPRRTCLSSEDLYLLRSLMTFTGQFGNLHPALTPSESLDSVAKELGSFGAARVSFLLAPYHSTHICWFGHTLISQFVHTYSVTSITQWWLSCFPSQQLHAQLCTVCPPPSLHMPGILPTTVHELPMLFLCKTQCVSSPLLSFPGNSRTAQSHREVSTQQCFSA